MRKKHVFTAVIEPGRGGGAFVAVPLDVPALFGTRGQVKVKARFDDVDYRGSIAPMDGHHVLGIRKSVREAIGKEVGDPVRVTLERDAEEREIELPAELLEVFRSSTEAREGFRTLAYTHRREIAESVASAKKPETRERRARAAVTRILALREHRG